MRTACLTLAATLACPLARADQLPFRTYGTSEGLPSSYVVRITRDSRGLLWFATRDGLARFDGSRFVSYGTELGLPVPTINHVLETRDGLYWVATNGGGVYRMAPDLPLAARAGARTGLRAYGVGEGYASRVNVLHEDGQGRIWAGTDGGLFVLEPRTEAAFRFVPLPAIGPSAAPVGVRAFAEDGEGNLWVGALGGLFRRRADGRFVHYPLSAGLETGSVRALARDGQGRMWAAAVRGLLAFVPDTRPEASGDVEVVHTFAGAPEQAKPDGVSVSLPSGPGEARWYQPAGNLPRETTALCITSDGHVWVTLVGGVLRELSAGSWRTYTAANGIADDVLTAIAEDRDGNLWIGGRSVGAMKLTRGGFTRYDATDGLLPAQIHSFFQDAAGSLFVVSGDWVLSRFDGVRFASVRPRPPGPTAAWASEAAWLDHSGTWWLLTGNGLGRLPRVEQLEDLRGRAVDVMYGPRNGLPRPVIARLFEDRRGDLWASGRSSLDVGLARWDRASGRWHTYSEKDGLPPGRAPGAFVEDAAGTLWIGLLHGGLMRYRGGRFVPVPQEALTRAITAAYRDDRGDLWIGSSQDGLLRVVDPTRERPRFDRYTVDQGLASNNVRCLTSDHLGRIYVGTARGVDRLDPDRGRVRHYTTADGLANSFVTAAFRDRAGAVWFGTMHGLSRLVPEPDPPRSPPPVWIAGVSVNGVPRPVSHLGQASVDRLELGPSENQVQIDFFGLGFAAGEALRYQYRLDGADREWSQPNEAREVHYARLTPGRYQFQVRAVTVDGDSSRVPARVQFAVLPPLWQRQWFQAAVALTLALLGYGIHRHRLRQALALERVRTRIASDLHDDIGSTVSRMAILSEVAKRQVEGTHAEASRVLEEIGTSARGLLDTTGDIVWAIDPRRDDGASLVARVRAFGAGLFEARGIAWDFQASPEAQALRLDPEQRRQLLLIFKEALHNISRHAQCASACVSIATRDGVLQAEIRDDGRGFSEEQAPTGSGHGLGSMRARARHLGGALRVHSRPGAGTCLTLQVPLHRRGA
jgi:ligand-binding sensor domain-containing protein/signal transduction histidine kinase